MVGGVNDYGTWADSYNGDSDPVGPSPYGFDGSPNNRIGQSQAAPGTGGSPLGALSAALMQMGNGGGGLTVDPGASGAMLDTSGYGSDIQLQQPGYTDPTANLDIDWGS